MSATSPSGVPGRDERAAHTRDLLTQAATTNDEHRHDLQEQVVLLHLDVARTIALRYRDRGVPVEDLVQAANEGLVKATTRFDPGLQHDFLSYAVPTMRGEVRRWFRDHGWSVRPPRRVQELQWRRARAVDGLHQQLGREPSRAELAERLDVDPSEVEEADGAHGAFTPASLDRPSQEGDGEVPMGELLPGGDDGTAAAEARAMLRPVVRRLGERDRRVLFLRFFEDWTQREIGEEIGVSQMQVSRTLARVLETLREDLGQDLGEQD